VKNNSKKKRILRKICDNSENFAVFSYDLLMLKGIYTKIRGY
jgi:hypothetical protein